MTVNEQFEIFIEGLCTRRRNPAKPATIYSYRSYHKNHIKNSIGKLEVSQIENGQLKKFVTGLNEKNLAPTSVSGITQLVKSIVASVVDDNGNRVFDRHWNNDFLDLIPIDPKDQKAPIMTREALEMAFKQASGQFRTLCILLAGSGLRISEAIALKVGIHKDSSYWDFEQSKLVIKKALYRGIEQSTKTRAGEREVDLCKELNDYLIKNKPNTEFMFAGQDGRSARIRTLYDLMTEAGIPGFHSARRYRVTFLRSCGVPEDILKYWVGHSSNSTITDRYSKLAQNIELRKRLANEVGLGFEIPKEETVETLTMMATA